MLMVLLRRVDNPASATTPPPCRVKPPDDVVDGQPVVRVDAHLGVSGTRIVTDDTPALTHVRGRGGPAAPRRA